MKAFPISQDLDVIQAEVDLNTAKVTDLVHPLVETAVPLGALFTDTIYDDSAIQAEVDLNTDKVTDLVHPLVETAVPIGALFTDTVYDDATIQAEVDLNTAKVTDLVHPLVETAVPIGALFTDTVYDDSNTLVDSDAKTLVTPTNKLITEDDVISVASMFEVEIDVGATPVSEASISVTDASITTSSKILGSVAYLAPTGKDLDEIEMDTFDLKFEPLVGSFNLKIKGLEGYIADKFKINYSVSV